MMFLYLFEFCNQVLLFFDELVVFVKYYFDVFDQFKKEMCEEMIFFVLYVMQ